ncbi:MAG: NUDIX hydrolase [Ignavibacteria bacterium]|nr:NUDIX hydrolase [Ignavibacteria bacterium]
MTNLKLLNRKNIYNGVVFDIVKDECEYISSGTKTIREVAFHNGGAVVVPMLNDKKVILVKQFRYPLQQEIIELPAGKLFKNEEPLHCAKRELEEETGYVAKKWKHLTSIFTTPGFCSEQLHIFLAQDLHKAKGGRKLEEGEEGMELLVLPFDKVLKMIKQKKIVDGKTISGIMLAMLGFKDSSGRGIK